MIAALGILNVAKIEGKLGSMPPERSAFTEAQLNTLVDVARTLSFVLCRLQGHGAAVACAVGRHLAYTRRDEYVERVSKRKCKHSEK